jgi:alkylation response protein AidB-like acyl-CoA dehydrogenase
VPFPFRPEEEAFRQQIRAFCRGHLRADLADRVRAGVDLERDDYVGWQRTLAAGGLLCGAWPVDRGGQGWSALQSYLFDEECALAGAPWLLPFGVNYVGPVILEFGSPEQKERFLPGIVSADTFWCQGYSEPDAGSDLASLKTKAIRDGDSYVVTGRKIWTTMAHWADRMFCLVRTSGEGKPQAGISFLLIDMRSPGVTIRPIVTIEGRHHLNEVILDEVRVPVADRVGDENRGWTIAKFLLSNERLLVAEIGKQKRLLATIREAASGRRSGGRPLIGKASVAATIAELEVRLAALEWTALLTVRGAESAPPSAQAVSMLKVRGSELEQALTQAAFDILGPAGLLYDPGMGPGDGDELGLQGNGIVQRLLTARATSIYGGSNEVQRNIIAKCLVGL